MRIFGLNLRLQAEQAREMHEEIEEMSQPTWGFYAMVGLSGIIATYGLLAGSTAVVIGAMLVAPLMWPIFGIALGLAIGDRKLLFRAMRSEFIGIVTVIGLSYLIGLFPLRFEFGPEIIMRTQPTIYDMIVGLAAGLAGTYAQMNERISPSLPGVAIAVAVVPPLAVAGLCLAAGRYGLAGGAMLLFLANFLAIEVAGAFLYTIYGIVSQETDLPLTLWDFFRGFSVSLVALAAIAYFMTNTFVGVVSQNRLEANIETILRDEIHETAGARLTELDFAQKDDRLEVLAAVMTPREIGPVQVREIEKRLEDRLDRDLHLVLGSVVAKNYDRDGPVFIKEDELKRRARDVEETNFRNTVASIVENQIQSIPGAALDDIRYEKTPGRSSILASVRTPTAVQPADVAEAEDRIRSETGRQVHLIIRSVITRDASAEQFIYEPEKAEPAPPSEEEIATRTRLEEALRNQLSNQVEAATLQELRFARSDQTFTVFVIARTPQPFTPQQVAQIQANLRDYVDPRINLFVRSNVGATVSAQEYLQGASEADLLQKAE